MQQPSVTIRNGRFTDAQHREVILHGVNYVNKNPKEGYLFSDGPEAFEKMRQWGFNCVRLGVIWDGLEPRPGEINGEYLSGIERQVTWAAGNGLAVILDMHQDLYSVLYSDGAPAWATLTDGAPHVHLGGVWSDDYFTSPAVQTALDHFWSNTPAPDGAGLQDHFAACWQALAARFSDQPAVIGFDLYNEPFPGAEAVPSQMMLFAKGAELLAEIDPSHAVSPEELAGQWLDPAGRSAILALIDDPERFARVVDVTEPVYAAFERGRLMPFYQRVANAIRAVDTCRILFLGTSMGANMGVFSAIQPVIGPGGAPDPAQAYAPHGYDLVVDTPYLAQASANRTDLIFTRHGQTARRLGLPMLVGEWGAFSREIPGTLGAARAVSAAFERLLCGDTYWHFDMRLEEYPPFQAISRPYLERAAGRMLSYHYDPTKDTFECAWEEEPGAGVESVVYLPKWFASGKEVLLMPESDRWSVTYSGNGEWLCIPPAGQPGRRSLMIKPETNAQDDGESHV